MHEPARALLHGPLLHSHGARLGLAIAAMALLFGALAPGFWTLGNWMDVAEGASVTAIMAVGLLVVLVAGGIDISFAATATVAQYLAALAATRLGWPPAASIALGLATGLALGACNALLIHRLRASIIITISTLNLYFALLMHGTGGRSIYDLPPWWSDSVVLARFAGADGADPVRLTLPIAVAGAAALLTALLLGHSALGRRLYALGGHPEAAHRMGIGPGAIQAVAYGWLGTMAALAGLVQAHRVGESVPNALVGTELFVLAAAVLGGASLFGGTGSVGGVLMGVLLLAVLRNGLNLIGVSPYFFQLLLGAVVLACAAAAGLQRQQRRSAALAPSVSSAVPSTAPSGAAP
jgi:simple sugar transport system permease protein